jgi:mRNA interferase RelE/StbE
MSGVSWEFEIILSEKAIKALKELDRHTQARMKEAIGRLAGYPPQGDITRLKGGQGELRLRAGDWRITFEYRFKDKQVSVLTIRHRREAYR